MGVKNRIEDALLLWENDRLQGAFLMALVSVAATARKRYPKKKDREAFEQFLQGSRPGRLNVEYCGVCQPIEHILYKYLRCELVHKGDVPIDIQFQDDKHGSCSVRAGGKPEYILKIDIGWFNYLIDSVRRAPENSVEFRAS